MERRYTNTETEIRVEKRDDGTARITGYGAVFYRKSDPGTQYDLWDNMVERVDPTAFDRAVSESDDARGLFNHDPSLVLGRVSSGTMRLTTDRRGLKYEIDVPDTQAGRDIVTSIERGDVSGSSFAFRAIKEEWRTEKSQEIRTILDVELFDTGPVTYPAYQSTTTGVRSDSDAEEARTSFLRWKAERDEKAASELRLDEAAAILAGLE